jgi:monoamine oxidase
MHRKDFLRLSGWGLAAAPLFSFSKLVAPEPELYDVAIIGAGLSGLAAARLLTKSGKRVIVLEAQDRVGGRTWSLPIGNHSFLDVGGQWIGKGHNRMYALAAEGGIKTFPTFTTGKSLFRYQGKNKPYSGSTPPIGLWPLLSAQRMINKFDRLAAALNLEQPWLSQDAAAMEQISLGEWISETNQNEKACMLMKLTAEGELCMPVENVSLLQAVAAARATGSLKQAEKVEGGALQDRLCGGAQGVSEFMYKQLKDQVRLNSAVTFVHQPNNHVELGGNNFSVRAKKLIIAAPLAVLKNISFTPELPPEKQMLINSMTMGTVIKIHVVYTNPFWRTSGWNGSSTTLNENIELTVDNSVPGTTEGILTSLIHARRAKELLSLSRDDRKKAVLDAYVNLFGEAARTPVHYHDYSFSENPWIGGAYSGFFAPGIFAKYGSHIAKPTGPIHWAGTETSLLFRGFMEGAVLAGERAAREVL